MKKTYQNLLKQTSDGLPRGRHDTSVDCMYVVDGMNLAHAAKHSYGGLSAGGKSTSLLFGVPQMLKSLMQLHSPKKVVVCWDGLRSPHRLALLPGYKSHRGEKTKEELDKWLSQLRSLRVLLKSMGIPQAYDLELEGDDMIYLVANRYVKTHRIIIVSRDKDLRQFINRDISVLNPVSKETYSWQTFMLDMGVRIDQYVDYLCLCGDKSDDIPGIVGIGPARASKFLSENDSIAKYLKGKKDFPGIEREELAKIYHTNRLMIDIPHFLKTYHPDKGITWYKDKKSPSFKEEKYRELCQKWRLKTMLTETFQKPFKEL